MQKYKKRTIVSEKVLKKVIILSFLTFLFFWKMHFFLLKIFVYIGESSYFCKFK